MPTTKTIKKDNTLDIDLGNSANLTIAANNGDASVHIDYNKSGNYSSAIKGSAGYGNPFTVRNGSTKVVSKSDLESERVRVGVRNNDVSVTY